MKVLFGQVVRRPLGEIAAYRCRFLAHKVAIWEIRSLSTVS